MTKETLQRGLAVLSATFPEKQFNAKVYLELLIDLDDKAFLLAIKEFCSTTEEIYPGTNVIGKLRKIAKEGIYKLSGEAWEEVLKQVTRGGYVSTPKFNDKIIAKAVQCVGWKDICLSEKISIERAHFLKIYEQLLNREKTEEVKPEDCKQINRSGIDKVKRLTEGV